MLLFGDLTLGQLPRPDLGRRLRLEVRKSVPQLGSMLLLVVVIGCLELDELTVELVRRWATVADARLRKIRLRSGANYGLADLEGLPFGAEALPGVVKLSVELAALDDGVVEHVADRAAKRLCAVDHDQDGRVTSKPRSRSPTSRSVTTVAFSVAPSASPSGILVPSMVMLRATTQQCLATRMPSTPRSPPPP